MKKKLLIGFALGWFANMVARTNLFVNWDEEEDQDGKITILSISFAVDR